MGKFVIDTLRYYQGVVKREKGKVIDVRKRYLIPHSSFFPLPSSLFPLHSSFSPPPKGLERLAVLPDTPAAP